MYLIVCTTISQVFSRQVVDHLPNWSFTFIEDCLNGVEKLMASRFSEPINIGSSEMVSINGLVDIVESIGSVTLKRKYKLDAPKGVNGRNSDNTLIQTVLDWEPDTQLKDGMAVTFEWIRSEMNQTVVRGE